MEAQDCDRLPAPHNVLLQQLMNDVADVGHVDFVDETIDGLLQRLPAHSLVCEARDKTDSNIMPGLGGGLHSPDVTFNYQPGQLITMQKE